MKLAQARRIATALPSVTEEPHFAFASFRVGAKIFATAPPDGEHLHVFVDEEERQVTLALEPNSVEILTWGKRVVGLRVVLAKATPALVTRLLVQARSRKAPKRLRTARSRTAISGRRTTMLFDRRTTYVNLGSGGKATRLAGGDAFWALPDAEMDGLGDGRLVSGFEFTIDWPTWEMHPNGDEFVYLLSGSVDLMLEQAQGVEMLAMRGMDAVVVPHGVWHTAKVLVPR